MSTKKGDPHPLDGLPGVTPRKRKALVEAGFETPQDLVECLPRRYLDRSEIGKLAGVREGDEVLADVRLRSVRLMQGRRERLVATAHDGTATVELVWFFSARWLSKKLEPDMRLLVWGKVGWFRGPQIVHPEFEILADGEEAKGAIVPIYPSGQILRDAKIDHRQFQQLALGAFARCHLGEILPSCLRGASTTPRPERLIRIHKPESLAQSQAYLLHEQAMAWFPTLARLRKRKRELLGRGRPFAPSVRLRSAVLKALPFTLHQAQKQAVEQLEEALTSGNQIHVLLQGDVGSGKTLICLLAALPVLEAGAQVAILAPTEVLARQHLSTFRKLLAAHDVPVLWFAAGQTREERIQALGRLAHGKSAVAIGTHALLSDDVVFRDLAMVVVDEQHRFGVGQRQKLVSKGSFPHVIAASATPIPRSMLLATHGDMDVIEVRGRPEGRLGVRCRVLGPDKIPDMMSWLSKELEAGQKLFWVVPRVDESEEAAASVEGVAERLNAAFGANRVATLHGRMDGFAQGQAIDALREGRVSVLVSTTVVEVGVDIPDANLMVIENPEFFGLAQLHQLRGRVGRGGGQAWCFLLPGDEDKYERLRRFSTTEDGFDIAELDLEERGAGDLEGKDQSGGGLGRSGLLKEHIGLLDRWREGVDEILAGRLPLDAEEKERFLRWYAEDTLGEALTA